MTVTEEKTERQFLVYLPVNFGQTYVFLLVILPRPSNRKPSSTFYCIISKHNLSHHQGFWNDLNFNVWLLFLAFSIFTWNAITTICPPQSPQQCNCQWKSSCRSPQTLCRTSASLLGRASRQKGAWAGARPPGRITKFDWKINHQANTSAFTFFSQSFTNERLPGPSIAYKFREDCEL